jgi:glycerophosphoryl diester phosphodiesterase
LALARPHSSGTPPKDSFTRKVNSVVTTNPWLRPHRPLSIAHRGHSIEVPENTIEAYRRAIELGAEMIEADVHLTRDGHLIMLHDDTLDRTTTGRGAARDAALPEVQLLDAGSWMGPEFRGLRVPTTQAFLDLAEEAGIPVCLEVKGGDAREADAIATALVHEVLRRDAVGWAFLSSYHHGALALAKQIAPDLLLAPERLPDHLPPDPPEALRQARALGAPVLQHQYMHLSQELVQALHDADIAIWSWTVNRPPDIAESIALGVDAVMGDDVTALQAALDRQSLGERATHP